jgi:hypothetical protein
MSDQNPIGCFLRSSELKPGDVLLTRSTAKFSNVISYATDGPYSHAGIWLPLKSKTSQLVLVESDGYGVGPTALPNGAYATLDGTSGYDTFFANVECADIYRHPTIATVTPEVMAKATQELVRDELLRGYSKLERLAETVDRFPHLRSHIALALRVIDRSGPDIISGRFCSELVSRFFELVGLTLFDSARPHQISPNALAKSLLQKQSSIVIPTSELSAYRISTLPLGFSRAATLPTMVRMRSRSIRHAEQVAVLDKSANIWTRDALQSLARSIPQSISDCEGRRGIALQFGNKAAAQRFKETAAAFQLIGVAANTVSRRDELFQEPDRDDGSLRIAKVHLLSFIQSMFDQATVDFMRRSALLDLKLARRSVRENLPGALTYLRTARNVWLENWATHMTERRHPPDWQLWMPDQTPKSREIVNTVLASILDDL